MTLFVSLAKKRIELPLTINISIVNNSMPRFFTEGCKYFLFRKQLYSYEM